MENKLKTGLFVLLLMVFMLPAIQHKFRLFEERGLNGYAEKPVKPSLSLSTWTNGKFQEQEESYVNQVVGFRPDLIRLNNEINFSLYEKITAQSVVLGKDGYLFEEGYIHTALGKVYLGKDSIAAKVKRLKALQERLAKQNTHLLFVIAPGKGSVFFDKIPDAYQPKRTIKTNYNGFLKAFKQQGINYIDFQSYVINNRSKEKAPWMCQTGIHWSNYFETVAGDSIFNYCRKHWQVKIPRMIIDQLTENHTVHVTDFDIEESLNLIRDLPNFKMKYPMYHFDRATRKSDDEFLFVGDSFNWGIFNFNAKMLKNSQFWYYNREVYQGSNVPIDPKDLDLNKILHEKRVVILLFNEGNLKDFGYGFIERALHDLN